MSGSRRPATSLGFDALCATSQAQSRSLAQPPPGGLTAPLSDHLDDGGDAHAAADAERGEAAAQVATAELVDEGAEDHRPGRAQRVAHGDRAAVDVGDLVGDP